MCSLKILLAVFHCIPLVEPWGTPFFLLWSLQRLTTGGVISFSRCESHRKKNKKNALNPHCTVRVAVVPLTHIRTPISDVCAAHSGIRGSKAPKWWCTTDVVNIELPPHPMMMMMTTTTKKGKYLPSGFNKHVGGFAQRFYDSINK